MTRFLSGALRNKVLRIVGAAARTDSRAAPIPLTCTLAGATRRQKESAC